MMQILKCLYSVTEYKINVMSLHVILPMFPLGDLGDLAQSKNILHL